MRVALINEGTYPVVKGGVSTWCDQLVRGLDHHEFHLVTLVGRERECCWTLPANVTRVSLVPMWDRPPAVTRVGLRARRHQLDAVLQALWETVLPAPLGPPGTEDEPDTAVLGTVLRELGAWASGSLLGHLLERGSTRWVLDAWEAHRRLRPGLPILSLSEAAEVARLTDRILAVAGTQLEPCDLIHVASNGPASLIGLAAHWRDGTPMVLTEHGIYLRERYLALGSLGLSFAVRYAVMALIRAICRVTYDECAAISPVSDFNGRWQERLGASPARIRTIHNGVDMAVHVPVTGEPDVPTVSFVGRIDPLKDLETLIMAFALVKAEIPTALMRLFGPTPVGNEDYRAELESLIAELSLGAAVSFEGPSPTARPAFEAGHVVALSSISEGLPFTVMEAMMSGRPTVSTDVGGVAEVVGSDGTAGVVVPPRDPEAMATQLVALLRDPHRRATMGLAARERAARMFDLRLFRDRYTDLYAGAAQPAPPQELSPAAPLGPEGDARAGGTRAARSRAGGPRVGVALEGSSR